MCTGILRLVLGRMLVEERHKRAVSDEGRDAVGFIGRELERADPQEVYSDGDAHQHDAAPSGMTEPARRPTKMVDPEFSSCIGTEFGGRVECVERARGI